MPDNCCILCAGEFYLSAAGLKVQGDLFEIDTKWILRHPRYTQIGAFVFGPSVVQENKTAPMEFKAKKNGKYVRYEMGAYRTADQQLSWSVKRHLVWSGSPILWYGVEIQILTACQGGITCGAIEDPRKSSKAIDERVIINFLLSIAFLFYR